MGKFKDFAERRKTGCYVSCQLDSVTKKNLAAWCAENLIPSPLDPEKYHVTVLYSRTDVPDAAKIAAAEPDHGFKAKGFNLFDSPDDPSKAALVIELNAPQLVKLHEKLIKAGGTHDYEEYIPHVTVTYYADKNHGLDHLKLPDFQLKVSEIKAEPLDLNWNDK